ncbi:Ribonuclease 3-like protein 3 [Euphorbia peplus]|nr:Ribonuclease 3-like protein 3 [Euphorbia peplus]
MAESDQQPRMERLEIAEEASPRRLDGVEEIIGYEFKDKRLLEEAFTDSSCHQNISYERLEYIGDSALNLMFTKEHFVKYPDMPPGALTRLRAANVDTEKLARAAFTHGFHLFLRHNKPLLEDQIRKFSEAIKEYPLHSNGLVDVPKVLADIVESTVGAVFIDTNFSLDQLWKVFKKLLEPIISRETVKVHPVTQLYEECQKRNLKVKFVDTWRESMGFHVLIDDKLVGRATYALKKEIAHNRAAKDALDNISTLFTLDQTHDHHQSSTTD